MSGKRVLMCSGGGLVGLYALGALLAPNPDFDATFGIEAYREIPTVAFVAAGVLLAVLLHVERVAGALGRYAAALPSFTLPVFLTLQAVLFLLN